MESGLEKLERKRSQREDLDLSGGSSVLGSNRCCKRHHGGAATGQLSADGRGRGADLCRFGLQVIRTLHPFPPHLDADERINPSPQLGRPFHRSPVPL